MGSAFPAEPIWVESDDYVTFVIYDPDILIHRPRDDCDEFYPHHIDECGIFQCKEKDEK